MSSFGIIKSKFMKANFTLEKTSTTRIKILKFTTQSKWLKKLFLFKMMKSFKSLKLGTHRLKIWIKNLLGLVPIVPKNSNQFSSTSLRELDKIYHKNLYNSVAHVKFNLKSKDKTKLKIRKDKLKWEYKWKSNKSNKRL